MSRLVRPAVALGLLSIAGLGMSHLALTDIYHGEPDLVAEWTVLQVSGLVLAAFVFCSLAVLVPLARSPRQG